MQTENGGGGREQNPIKLAWFSKTYIKHRLYMRQKYRVLGIQTARFLVSTSSKVGGEQGNTKVLRVRGEVLRRKVCAGINKNTATLAPDFHSSQYIVVNHKQNSLKIPFPYGARLSAFIFQNTDYFYI